MKTLLLEGEGILLFSVQTVVMHNVMNGEIMVTFHKIIIYRSLYQKGD